MTTMQEHGDLGRPVRAARHRGAAVPRAEGGQPAAASASTRPTRCTARFDNIGGLKPRRRCKSAGVMVGRVDIDHASTTRPTRALVTLEMQQPLQFPEGQLGSRSSPPACSATSTSASRPAATRRTSRAGDMITQTQSAVVLENLISQFLFNKAADGSTARAAAPRNDATMTPEVPCAPCAASFALRRWRSAAVLALAAAAPAAHGQSGRPVGAFNREVFELQRGRRRRSAEAGRHGLHARSCRSSVRTGVNNFFGNLADVWSSSTTCCRASCSTAPQDVHARDTSTPSSASVGLLDVASEAGIEHHNEDFGQTLGRWGVPSRAVSGAAAARARRRCATRLRCRSTGRATCSADHHDGTVRNSAVPCCALIDTRANLLRREPVARRYRARQVHLHRATPTCSAGADAGATTATCPNARQTEAGALASGCARRYVRAGQPCRAEPRSNRHGRADLPKLQQGTAFDELQIPATPLHSERPDARPACLLAGRCSPRSCGPRTPADEAPDALVKRLSTDVLDTVKADKSIQAGDVNKIIALVDTKIMPQRRTSSA